MNTLTPEDCWRSEAFAEDLFDDGREAGPARPRQFSSALLFALPLTLALLGGVVAFFQIVV